jgi:diguanylate cyclase (GGDEF)-like protein
MPADFPGRLLSRVGRGASHSRRARDEGPPALGDQPGEHPGERLGERPEDAVGDLYTVDDLGDPTIEKRINRTTVDGVLCYPVVAVAAGPDLGAFATLALQDDVLVGRDPKAELELTDPGVSRLHARITWRPDGRFLVEDLGSTNGVLVQGQRVRQVVVDPGTVVVISSDTLVLDLLDTDRIDHMRRVNARLLNADGRDPLTGLATRLFMDDKLPDLVAEARRTGCYLCCLFLDLDHFKNVNDTYGHQVGDAVLRQVAHIAVKACRQEDSWVRYGGEELVGFMPGTDEEAAWRVAERLRQAILCWDWSRIHKGLQVTASIGLSRLRPGEPVESWVGRADQALYLAKRNGRNRVERAD